MIIMKKRHITTGSGSLYVLRLLIGLLVVTTLSSRVVLVVQAFATTVAPAPPSSPSRVVVLADELSTAHIERVNRLVATALGDEQLLLEEEGQERGHNNNAKLNRYEGARALADSLQEQQQQQASASIQSTGDSETFTATTTTTTTTPSNELVYGELSIPVLATLLDAVGVQNGDRFLDIGSGDGALVLGASLLYPDNYIAISRGVELIPGLVDRSNQHLTRLQRLLLQQQQQEEEEEDSPMAISSLSEDRVEFSVGNVYEASSGIKAILADTTLAVCFATTWSMGNSNSKTSLNGRRLPKLSKALQALPLNARVVIVDGKLDEKDGYHWEGNLKIYCPDTAPYSIASLYTRCR